MTKVLEEAQALGFDSIEQCKSHQQWLHKMAQHRKECAEAVRAAQATGIVDLRIVKTWPQSTGGRS